MAACRVRTACRSLEYVLTPANEAGAVIGTVDEDERADVELAILPYSIGGLSRFLDTAKLLLLAENRVFHSPNANIDLGMNLLDRIQNARAYDLGQPYFPGMPHFPTHPPYLFGLTKAHGDLVLKDGVSSSADAIALGTHVGTHIDALCHFSRQGKLHGGIEAESNQSRTEGMKDLAVDTVGPLFRRGVLLDIAAAEGVGALPPDFAIAPEHLERCAGLEGVQIARGDVVLLRTGWGAWWQDPARYITGGRGSQPVGPGPERAGAAWLSSRGIFAAGSDTIAFERVPSGMEVHVHLLVESGIHIIEALNLEELAEARVYEFVFVGIPMKLRGATGSPLRPIALAEGSPA